MSELPGVAEGAKEWRVRGKLVAWERPLRRADLEALAIDPPDEPILGVRVPDVGAQRALVADDPDVFFITPHFAGYPAVLIWLERIDPTLLAETLIEAWTVQAPKRLADEFWRDGGATASGG